MYSSAYRTGYGTGRTGEDISVWTGPRSTVGAVPLICCHGYLAGADQGYDVIGTPSPETWRAAARGIPCFWPDLGDGLDGLNYWGHDDVVAAGGAIDDAIAWAASEYGTRTDQVAIYGTSMGGTALGWCWRNPTLLAAAAFTIPAVDVQGIYDRDPVSLAASIDLAYADGWAPNAATHDPSAAIPVGLLSGLAGRIRVWYSSDDNVIAAAEVERFAERTGIVATDVGAVGHSLDFDQRLVFDWLLERLGVVNRVAVNVDGDLNVSGDLAWA